MKKIFSLILIIIMHNYGNAQSSVEELKKLSNLELIKEGNQLTEIKLPAINEKTIDLNDLKGKYVFINFWATWCTPCIKNMPYFEKLIEEHKKDNIEFVFVSIDKSKEIWKHYVLENELKGIQLFAPEGYSTKSISPFLIQVYEKNGQITSIERGIPRYILIDPKGIISENDLEKSDKDQIKELLNIKLKK
ncbi:TlpA disulfide reductase family protein [Flavivirga aquimarina]|uniref:TlpA disulfide reductase family protein n=1 Tax=Flavivirga aquimarina TaxID=2027862 RepID=A0ABT8W8U8_9FLAO|nr:TlpA disulfide reductase family protein [Flavivirga aquimarina]MDO5969559.1 TlpA disulfide reductase family protein [Flavivirga aquimarina]